MFLYGGRKLCHKKCDLFHEGHIVNESSIFTHTRTESDLTDDEKNQLATFGKMGSTGLNAHNGLFRLFTNRTYDSALVYRPNLQRTE